MRFFQALLGIFLLANNLSSQTNSIKDITNEDVKCIIFSDTLSNTVSGGFNQPRIALLDITNDSLPELFVLNYYSPAERLKIYKNNGNGKFSLLNNSVYQDLKARSWIRFADINSDGAADFFTSGEFSEVLLYKNLGTQVNPIFSAIPDTLKSDNFSIVAQQITIPNFCDIDHDNDLDLFIGNLDGTITYYKNIGTKENHKFHFETPKFAGIYIVSNTTVEDKKNNTLQDGQHGSSCIEFSDVDNDGDLDIFFSDFFLSHILFFENTGNSVTYQYNANKPDTGRYISYNSYTQIVNIDIDNDGRKDIITSALLNSKQEDEIIFYKNVGTQTNPIFSRQKQEKLFTFLDEFDIGTLSSLATIQDKENNYLIISNAVGQLWLFQIIVERTIFLKYIKVITPPEPMFYAALTAEDLDNDGVAEIIIGNSEGTLKCYNLRNGNLFPKRLNNIDTIKVNQNSNPFLCDFDNDNDFDLFLGAGNGKVNYYQNIGNSRNPIFVKSVSNTPLDTTDIGSDAVPRVFDLFKNGDLTLIVGGRGMLNKADEVRFYTKQNSNYELDRNHFINSDIHNPSPFVLNKNSQIILCGNYSGGLKAYKIVIPASVNEVILKIRKLSLW